MMSRLDYEAFIHICYNNNVNFKLLTYEVESGYNLLFSNFFDVNTIIKDEDINLNYDIGVSIDVFPIDGLGNSKNEALRIFRKKALIRRS